MFFPFSYKPKNKEIEWARGGGEEFAVFLLLRKLHGEAPGKIKLSHLLKEGRKIKRRIFKV